MKRTRLPGFLFLALSLATASLLLSAAALSAAEQTIQNGTDNGSIRVAVQDAGQMAVWRNNGSSWVQQTYGPYSKYSMLFLAGDNTSMRFSSGGWSPSWTAVSNASNADNTAIATVFLAADNQVRITQTISVTAGPYYRMQWAIENIGVDIYSDLRFTHGEDTYLAGNDAGEGHFDNALKMVYVTNVAAGIADMMGIYASASTPFTHYFQGNYSTNYTRMSTWTLDNTVNPNNVDAGYSLGWMRASLAPGETWTIVAYEKFTQSVGVQIIAPAEQEGAPGDTLTYAFTVRNLDAAAANIVLSSGSANGWATSVRDGSGNLLPGITLEGAAETVVYVRVAVPTIAAAGTTDLVTLTATFGGGDTSVDSTTTTVSDTEPGPGGTPVQPTFQSGGMGSGMCGMVVGIGGKGSPGPAEAAGLTALYFAILLAPVGFLKWRHARKRGSLDKKSLAVLLVAASLLASSSAHALGLIAPKAQRFHPATDDLGALTAESDETVGLGNLVLGITLSGAKKPLNIGDADSGDVQQVLVDELYTADFTASYGVSPDIQVGIDVPFNYALNTLNQVTGNREDDFHMGDLRLTAKFRLLSRETFGAALVPFVNFTTGNRDLLLSGEKGSYGVKAVSHLDVTKELTLYGNLGVELVGNFMNRDSAEYYTPWMQYAAGASYRLPGGKNRIVAEVNGETTLSKPFGHERISPIELLAAWRTEVAAGWTLQVGGGGGLNNGTGAPEWRGILGVSRRI